MLARVLSYGLMGIQGYPVQTEVYISNGLPAYDTVGLPDAAVRESKERVRAALRNSGYDYPPSRITVNLAPADLKKEGSLYDLPIALGLLVASGQLPSCADDLLVIGELALDGAIRPVPGVLPMIIDARAKGIKRALVPEQNAAEASYVDGVDIYPAATLRAAADFISGSGSIAPHEKLAWDGQALAYEADFSQIRGQQGAKRAAEIAAAGAHNMLLIGTPGSGKTMLARSIPSILPDLTFEEALEITKLHSIVGALKGESGIIKQRPFRAPHHSSSTVSLVGGGSRAMPGEISLAHYGVLFMDEVPEFTRQTLEALRQPLEDGKINIARASANATYPAQVMFVAAMNPCPCGNYGSKKAVCRCSLMQKQRYISRISGPLLDRIDLHVEMPEVAYDEIISKAAGETSAVIKSRVDAARRVQRERYQTDGILFNAQLSNKLIKQYCEPDAEGAALLAQAFTALDLSARAYMRILKVARTIADIAGAARISAEHISEAIQYRTLDRKYWGS